jgi:hypothetical protein
MEENRSIQNATLGDHNIYFYTSPKEKYKVLFSNLRSGLDGSCSALYIAGGETIAKMKVKMRNFGLELDDRKLKIVTSHQFYMPDGVFRVNRVVEQFKGLLDESIDRGFKGLYVSADVSDTFDRLSQNLTSWLSYENSFGRTFKFPIEAICTYRVDQIESNGQALLQLLQAHKNTLTAKTADLMDNEKLFMDALTEELNNIFGEKATKILFDYLETTFKLTRKQIPDKIEEFNKTLEAISNKKAATNIRLRILKNLHGKIEFSTRRWNRFLATQLKP